MKLFDNMLSQLPKECEPICFVLNPNNPVGFTEDNYKGLMSSEAIHPVLPSAIFIFVHSSSKISSI